MGVVRRICDEEGGWGVNGVYWVGGSIDVVVLFFFCYFGEY